MGKWMVVKDQDNDDHDQRSTGSLPAHTQKNKVIAQGISVYVGDSGGIGSANASINGVLADSDDIDDKPSLSPEQQAAVDAEFAAAGGVDSGNPTDTAQGSGKQGVNVPCGSLPSYPGDNYQLSQNFTLGQLSSKCVFPYRVAPQCGLSLPEIVCNLKALCVNSLEPLRAHYPNGFRVYSGFRVGSGKSQHYRGMAADIQWSGISNQEYLARAQWIRANLPFDQLIMEHGKSIWIHVSFKRGGPQRSQVLTMIKGDYRPGLKLYY